jgi:beta-fructofuranosidase
VTEGSRTTRFRRITRREALGQLARLGVIAGLSTTALTNSVQSERVSRFPSMSSAQIGDPQRPHYHFLPPRNWMNDPNGLIQFGGEYHFFYQHNPNGAVWGDIHWGHAVSKDLVQWKHLPVALAPTPGTPDAQGCWSGCAVDDNGVPTLLYTGVANDRQTQCLATSVDGLRTWQKYAGNPVLTQPPAGMKRSDFRDPFVWRHGREWLMVVGAALERGKGAALLYRSDDLKRWTYLHPLLEGVRAEHGWMWECPNFFALGDKHVLLVSNGLTRQVFYFVGSFDGRNFAPERDGLFSADSSYAPLTFRDDAGQRILFSWLDENRDREATIAAGWAGVASLPRTLSLDAQGRLRAQPLSALERLRGKLLHDASASPGVLNGVSGTALELKARVHLTRGATFGLGVRVSPDGEEGTYLLFGSDHGGLTVDRTRSSRSEQADRSIQRFALEEQDTVFEVHVFLDHSVLEVFVGGQCFCSRIYPTRAESTQVRVLLGGNVQLDGLQVWALKSVW